MLVDLVPQFLSVINAPDPVEAYYRYFEEHQLILDAYWRNYIIDPDSPQAHEIVTRALEANRRDLHDLLKGVDLTQLATRATRRCEDLFDIDRDTDVYLMVGVGGANAGELVVAGRGVAFVCIEHFTGKPNGETYGLGLPPDQIPLWIGHELAHTVRYTSPRSRSELARLIFEARGSYHYWETGGLATLRELIVNEGLAVAASRLAFPGFDTRHYLGYGSHQYRRMRELEAFLRRHLMTELDQAGIGYRLRYLAGGVGTGARTVAGKVIPERAGYYLGLRMVETAVQERGVAEALRMSAEECLSLDELDSGAQTA